MMSYLARSQINSSCSLDVPTQKWKKDCMFSRDTLSTWDGYGIVDDPKDMLIPL